MVGALGEPFVLQTYITYVFIVGMLAAWAVVCVWLRLRAAGYPAEAVPPRVRRAGVVALIVGVLCWLQPVLQQFVGEGPGNISRALGVRRPPAVTDDRVQRRHPPDGPVVTLPPWWFRPSFRNFLASNVLPLTSLAPAIVTIVILLIGMGLLRSRDAQARGDDPSSASRPLSAVVALVARVITAGPHPGWPVRRGSHVYRWLWPLAAFVMFVLVIRARA